ncbi:hypothetical protein COU54_04625 [Candidatus Pacearchaeota archaeon CG10_big_fil_rev_8_21_14_0_10_31_24]|nr:MAG: hypothetical protein COU54_04625 [Candidatus Pacearchaeota archaeon CG10_big_fil_rev_8_21_14_0_10_31_24]
MVVDIQSVLLEWQFSGITPIILPGLMLFAIIFGILSTTRVFGSNKGVHIVIALAASIIAVSSPRVQDFFLASFERAGIALAVLMIIVILTALFIPDAHKQGWAIAFYSIGGIAAMFVVFNSFAEFSFFNSSFWHEWGAMVVGSLLIVGVIIAVAVSGNKGDKKPTDAKFSGWHPEK